MQTARGLVYLIPLAVLAPMAARAQCSNLSGNPVPTPQPFASNLVKLRYLPTGPGFNDDRPLLKKSPFLAPSLLFDPINTHTVHVTFRKNTVTGPIMWTANIPPSTTLWSHTGSIFTFKDPATTFGVRKVKILSFPGGGYIIRFVKGMNTNITNAPLVPNTDNVYVMVEIEAAGVGTCYGGVTTRCRGNGNRQKCRG